MDCPNCIGDALAYDAATDTEKLCGDCGGEGEVSPCHDCDESGVLVRGACERECPECDGRGWRRSFIAPVRHAVLWAQSAKAVAA